MPAYSTRAFTHYLIARVFQNLDRQIKSLARVLFMPVQNYNHITMKTKLLSIVAMLMFICIISQTVNASNKNGERTNDSPLELIYTAWSNGGELEVALGYHKFSDDDYQFSVGAINNGCNEPSRMCAFIMGDASKVHAKLSAIIDILADAVMKEQDSEWVKIDDFMFVLFERSKGRLYMARDAETIHIFISPEKIKRVSYMKARLEEFCAKHNILLKK